MGFWTKIRKPLVRATIIGQINESGKAEKKRKQEARNLAQAQQAQITQLAQEKAIASESARLQEEKARKRTLFAGTALGEASERKKLLGL